MQASVKGKTPTNRQRSAPDGPKGASSPGQGVGRPPADLQLASRTPVPPGHFLETRFLIPLGISQQALAKELGISRRRVNELIRGHRGITPDTAIRLAVFFETDAAFWMGLQMAWDMHQALRTYRSTKAAPSRRN